MTLRDQLLHNSSLSFENNIFYQKELTRSMRFEKEYIKIREKENRVYSDEIVKRLPSVSEDHSLKAEWSARNASIGKVITYLKQKNHNRILELGCGNGWLTHNLAASLHTEICGMDINETELLQGARVFIDVKNISFIYGDIFTINFESMQFDSIILASSIQYFPNLKLLLNKLLELLIPTGEILILDSPFYSTLASAKAARKRSFDYFKSLGFPEMSEQYFHHAIQELKDSNYKVLYNPSSVAALIQRKIFGEKMPVFPIIQIQHI